MGKQYSPEEKQLIIQAAEEAGEARDIWHKKLKPGIYETEYGNAAEVESWNSETAWDLDMRESIPIEFVTDKFIREIE